MKELFDIPVNHDSGYNYSFSLISLDKVKGLVETKQGIFLPPYSDSKTQKEVYLLNTGELLRTSYADATLYSSFYGFLLNLQEYEKIKPKE